MASRRYRVTVADRVFEVEVGGEDGRHDVTVNGTTLPAELSAEDTGGVRRLRIGGRLREVLLAGSERGWDVAVEGITVSVEVQDERSARLARFGGATSKQAGRETITAPMPGLVVRVNVETGQEVTAGESLVVLQAMKMENELGSPRDGRIKAVSVEPGQAVEQGQVLVELE